MVAVKGGFTAKWHGTCGKCQQPISPGDLISQNGAGRPAVGYYGGTRYQHISCGIVRETIKVAVEAEREQVTTPVITPAINTLLSDWVTVVQETRKAVIANEATGFVISPRASIKGAQLLRSGVTPRDTVEAIFGRYRSHSVWAVTIGIKAEEFARKYVAISDAQNRWNTIARKAGTQHKSFKTLVMLTDALSNDDRNVWLSGPAGSGKTTAARKLAEALGHSVDNGFEFNGAIDTEYKLSGFVDAKGRVVSTAFRKIWENGGVYLFDECDASMPGALLAFNAALANGYAAFPDQMIKRHENTVVIAAANTWGFGGDGNYVGRAKLDAAFLDRFVTLSWGYDEELERKIALA